MWAGAPYPKEDMRCASDQDCYTPWELCNQATRVCDHKDLWPLFDLEWLGLIFTGLWMILCLCGAHAGGGTLIPFFRLFFGLSVVESIVISNLTVVVAGSIKFVTNFKHTHPLKKDT